MQFFSIGDYFDTITRSRKLYNRQLEPVCRKWDLTRNELDVLLFLYNNPDYDRATDIVVHRGMAKSHVSLSVTNLESRGLLLRTFSPEDRRTAHLKLTEKGIPIAEEGRDAQQTFISGLYRDIGEEELKLYRKVTAKVRENIQNCDITAAGK